MTITLKAPFPYFGGKSRVADAVWERLGDVANYVEPFAGSAAVLMRRPHPGKTETINDVNHYIVNFWRAVKSEPDTVALHADHPVTESDLHARHRYLVLSEVAQDFRARMISEPDYFCPRFAGWWVWGQCCWIGSGWCIDDKTQWRQIPRIEKSPIHRSFSRQLPTLSKAIGNGVHSSRRESLGEWMECLSQRLRHVRVCYGNWSRICSSYTTMTRLGLCGSFVDPPYAKDLNRVHQWIDHLHDKTASPPEAGKINNRKDKLYSSDQSQDVDRAVAEVHLWCRKWGADQKVRIALCGYDGEHNALESLGWSVHQWKANGGYGNRNATNKNAHRERIWFSPHCL